MYFFVSDVPKIMIFADSSDVIDKWTLFSKQMCPKYRTCAQKLTSWRSSPDSPDSPEMVQTGLVWPWVLHASGAKMTVVYTNSLKHFPDILMMEFVPLTYSRGTEFKVRI